MPLVYEFGQFRYDPAQRLLFRGAATVPLLPKVAGPLHVLIERHGCVVDKPELMKLLWPDCTVEEIGLARNVSLLRKALGDDEGTIIEPSRNAATASPLKCAATALPKPRRHFPALPHSQRGTRAGDYGSAWLTGSPCGPSSIGSSTHLPAIFRDVRANMQSWRSFRWSR